MPAGPRVAGLLATRRWLMLLLFSIAWSFAALAGATQLSRLSLTDRAALLTGAALIVAGWVGSRRRWGLWLLLGGPGSLVVAAALNGGVATTGAWIALSVSASHVAYGVVLLAGRRTGLLGVAVMAGVLVAIWSHRPTNVITGPLSVAGGWISVATLVVSALALWLAWHRLLGRALEADAGYAELMRRTLAEVAAQERSRAWRAAATVVHERLLSTIRYILQAPVLDREGLAGLVREPEPPIAPSAAEPRSVQATTAARIAADIVRVDDSAINLPISEEVRGPMRAAIVECALNAVQHGAATEVTVTATRQGDRVIVQVADNGSGPAQDPVPGLGWSTVLGSGLDAVGGSWELSRVEGRTVVSLSLPVAAGTDGGPGSAADDGFAQGRILMSAPLVAHAAVGVAFDVVLGLGSAWGAVLIAWSAAAAVAAALIVVWPRRATPARSLAVVLALAAVPWLILPTRPSADEILAVASAANAAGYAIIAVAVWWRWLHWAIGLGTWTIGVVTVSAVIPGSATTPVLVALVNCLVAVPVTVVVSSVGTRRFARAQEAMEAEREAIRREALRASAAALVDQHLSSCVTQAEAIIDGLAEGAELDGPTRRRLACLDGLIRATIQVDPVSDGGVARAAAQLVTSAFSRSVPITVGPIMAGPDMRPLPPALLRELELLACAGSATSIRVFTDPSHDYLCLQTRVDTDPARAAVGTCRRLDLDGITITTDEAEPGSVLLVAARRTTP